MKKSLCLLLSILMLITAATTVSAAAFVDTEGTNCEIAADVLSALDIVEGKGSGEYEPESLLTRAEMATIILRAINTPALAGKDIFADVPSTHWGYANVSTAYGVGIINGMDANTFAPDASVTYEQAVKMVVCALGYDVQAQASGGYPAGYLTKAAQLGILKGVSTESPMKRGDMAILLYNALDVKPLEKETYGDNSYTYSEAEETLAEKYLNVEIYRERITATVMTELVAPTKKLDADEALLSNDVVVKKGETDIQNMVGMRADVYTREDDETGMPVALAVVPTADCKTVTVLAKDIDVSTTKSIFKYTNAEGKEEEVLITGANVIYNGKAKNLNDMDTDITPNTGSVKIIEVGDQITLVVESYENHIAKRVKKDDHIVYYMEDGSITLNPVDSAFQFTLTNAKGKALKVEDINKWDILSIAASADNKILRVVVSDDKVSGKIDEYSTKDGIHIGENTYPVSNYMDTTSLTVPEAGMEGVFCLDFMGNVVAVDTDGQAAYQYAWLLDAVRTKGRDGYAQIKLFNDAGKIEIIDANYNIEFNGTITKPEDLLADPVSNPLFNDAGTAIQPQLVRLETQTVEEGKVKKLVSLETASNQSDPNMADSLKMGGDFSFDYYLNSTQNLSEYNGTPAGTGTPVSLGYMGFYIPSGEGAGTYFSRAQITPETTVFVVPQDPTDEKKYEVRQTTSLGYDASKNYKCLGFYDMNEKFQVGALVFYNNLSNQESSEYPAEGKPFGLVTGMSQRINKEGDEEFIVRIFNTLGKEVDMVVDPQIEVLYRSANADVMADDAWYIKNESGDVIGNTAAKNQGVYWTGTQRPKMYMPLTELVPGDVIHYEAEGTELKTISVVHRVEHPFQKEGEKGFEFINNGGNISRPAVNIHYNGPNLLSYATAVEVSSTAVLAETNIAADGKAIDSGSTIVKRTFPTTGQFVVWNKETKKAKAITFEDIVEDDVFFAAWKTTSQQLVVVYR